MAAVASDDPDESKPSGVPRRALLGGALGVAAAGFAGYEIAERTRGSAADASDVSVVPKGELLADDVQTALVDVYDRTSALARLQDLRTAYELLDDFPPGANPDRVGSLGWTATATAGASVNAAAPIEGGVVRLATGTTAKGTSSLHLGLDQHAASPVFTMEWRIRLRQVATEAEDYSVVFGALASVAPDVRSADCGPGMYWIYDRAAFGSTWRCQVAGTGIPATPGASVALGRTQLDTGRTPDDEYHRHTITCDGDRAVRFYLDDELVATASTNLPGDVDRYGQGLRLAKVAGTETASMVVDWFFLRRELPR